MVSWQSQNIVSTKIAVLLTFLLQPFIAYASNVYTGIWSSNFTIQNANLDKTNTSFILTKQIQSCPFQTQYLISPYLFDLNINDNIQFNISMTLGNQVTFSITNENQVSFQIAEICLKNVYVKQVRIVNPVFDSNQILDFYDKQPDNFMQGMQAKAFITGFTTSQRIDNTCLFLKNSGVNTTGFIFRFKTISSSQFQEINFNYIYYTSEYINKYYNIDFQNSDSLIQINEGQYPIYQYFYMDKPRCTGNSYYYQLTSRTKNYVNTLFTISGFNFISIPNKNDGIRAKISFDYQTNLFNYCTWGTSQIAGITSNFLSFQMINCQQSSSPLVINYQNSCLNYCPVGQNFAETAIDNRQVCQPCANQKCLTCNQGNCTSCQSSSPYLLQSNCYDEQPQNTNCSILQYYYVCSQCPYTCPNYCDNQGNCIKCPQGQYYYHSQCQSGDPPPNTYYDQNQKEYYDCHISCKTCVGGSENQCSSCDQTQFTLVNSTSCVCTDQAKGLNIQSGKCQTCQIQGCQKCSTDYTTCQKCQQTMKFDNTACICEDPSQNFVSELNKCATQYNLINCQQPKSYDPHCSQCLQGYYNYQGNCLLCSKGFYATNDNQCIGKCPQYCIYCLNGTSCLQYDDGIPCFYACSTCTIPNQQNSCTSCISKTRFLNQKTKSCDCVDGYEESGQVDCKQIPNPVKMIDEILSSSKSSQKSMRIK
ncbi:hypothetical protein ABPG74_006646 [Tetrahymena malaccensis]